MRRFVVSLALIVAFAAPNLALAGNETPRPDGIYVTLSAAPSTTFQFALVAKDRPFDSGAAQPSLSRHYPLDTPVSVIARSSATNAVSLVITVVKDGKQSHRLEARGTNVTGTSGSTSSDGPRVSAF